MRNKRFPNQQTHGENNIEGSLSQENKPVETTQTMLRITFPIVVILLLVAVVWFVFRRRKASRVTG